EQWSAAKRQQAHHEPSVWELFRGQVRRTTVLTILVCSLSLTAHWAFTYWYVQHLRNLPDVATWSDAERGQLVSTAMSLVMVSSIVGNFLAAALARQFGYRRTIAWLCLAYFASMFATYYVPRGHEALWYFLPLMGACAGLFGLFTMYMPPL